MSVDAIRTWIAQPQVMVRELFGVTPDPWQDNILALFPHNARLAMLASKGPGKTAVLAWMCWNFLLTRPHPNIAAVSITAENLGDNLWKEMAKWQAKSELLRSAFEWKKTRIESRANPATWWMAARSWPRNGSAQDQADTLAGLHNDYVMFVLDESGGMPDAVMVSAEAALSSCIEGHIVQAGNPTHREGPLFRAFSSPDRWMVVSVNGDPDSPKRSPRVSMEWAQDQIRAYGRDHPWVKVNVFGEFPPSSINTLISYEEIEAATKRSYRAEDISRAARVLGVDVALYGDDASVIFPRQGIVAFNPTTHRNVDGIQGASLVAQKWDTWDVDAAFIDNTGGFGTSWIDNLRLLNKAPIGVGFASSPSDNRYANKRAEMYFNATQWIRDGGQLPPMTVNGMPELAAALSRTTYTTRGDKLLLEPKAMIKDRLGYSPDHADGLALTFAHPVSRKNGSGSKGARHLVDYDPMDAWSPGAVVAAHNSSYDPFA